ncbi:hypothetical protein ABPG77_008904 [Micractinium sp. CCAP 211/92]
MSRLRCNCNLLILFGIPCLVLLIAFAFNDPSSLAVAVPLALLFPGPRDVLLAVASDMLRAVRRAARFVSRDDDELAEAAQALGQQAGARQAQQRARQPSWGRTAPPPPPPPPPVVDVEYAVYPPPPTEPPDKASTADAASAPSQFETHGQPPAPPYLHPGRRNATPQQQRDSHQPLCWQHQQPAGRSPSAAGAAGVPFSAGRRSPQQHQPPQHPGRQPRDDAWEAPAVSRRRMPRGGIRAAAAAAPSNVSSAAVAPRHRQRQIRAARAFGAAEQRAGDAPPLLLRPLFALVPFLRYWGGFL